MQLKHLLLYLLVLALLPTSLVLAQERGRDWDRECNAEKCYHTLYSGDVYHNASGTMLSVGESTSFQWFNQQEAWQLDYMGQWRVYIQPIFTFDGENLTASEFRRALKGNPQIDMDSVNNFFTHKFASNITGIKVQDQPLIESVTFVLTGYDNISPDEVTWGEDNISWNLRGLTISFSDLNDSEDSGFPLEDWEIEYKLERVGDFQLKVSNIQRNFRGENLLLDPSVTLQTADSENLEDTYVRSNAATTNYGASQDLTVFWTASLDAHAYIKWNISSIPSSQNILNAHVNLTLDNSFLDAGEGWLIHQKHLYANYTCSGGSWVETCPTWNLRAIEGSEYNSTIVSTQEVHYDNATGTVFRFDVTDIAEIAYGLNQPNLSIHINASVGSGGPLAADRIAFASKEDSQTSERPILFVEYEAAAGGDSCSDFESGSTNTVDCTDACTIDSARDMSGGDFIFTGSGTILVTAAITNWDDGRIQAGCDVRTSGSGGFLQ